MLGGRYRLEASIGTGGMAQVFRGILLGGPVAGHLAGVLILSALLLGILVPLDLRLLRRRVLGD